MSNELILRKRIRPQSDRVILFLPVSPVIPARNFFNNPVRLPAGVPRGPPLTMEAALHCVERKSRAGLACPLDIVSRWSKFLQSNAQAVKEYPSRLHRESRQASVGSLKFEACRLAGLDIPSPGLRPPSPPGEGILKKTFCPREKVPGGRMRGKRGAEKMLGRAQRTPTISSGCVGICGIHSNPLLLREPAGLPECVSWDDRLIR